MTEQEAVKIIDSLLWKNIRKSEIARDSEEHIALSMAVDALDKQTPTKVYYGECSYCRQAYSAKPTRPITYCWVCGQALDWSD